VATIPLYPYGYKLNYRGKKEAQEEKAAVVRLIYQKYIDGMNRYSLTWYLINHGILRPRGDSCAWRYNMVSQILMDERYVGTDKYPPILAKDLFDTAQLVRQKEKEKVIATRHESCNEKRKYPFSGFIRCGSCGSSYIRGLQHKNSVTRKASWRCRNYHLKNVGKCKASGNIYEEMLEVVCVEAYNRIRSECLGGKFAASGKPCVSEKNKLFDLLIQETIDQMKVADEIRMIKLQNDLNVLLNKRMEVEWASAPMDLSEYHTKKIKEHFVRHPMRMSEFEVEPFTEIFIGMTAIKPGELKLVLKNGNEVVQTYKPMKGQVENAEKYRSYSGKTDP